MVAAAAPVGCIVAFAAEEWVVGSAVGALVAETAAEAQIVLTPLHDPAGAAPARQSAAAEVVFVSA